MTELTSYSFIDVGYLIKGYTNFIQKWSGPNEFGNFDFDSFNRWYESEKYYYYDAAEDGKKEGETEEEFQLRSIQSDSRFLTIGDLPNCHLNLGKLVYSGKRRRQKGVDIWLAVDALSHAYSKNFRRLRLIAGDADFVPLIEALIRLGIIVQVISIRESVSDDLLRVADDDITLYNWHLVALTEGGCRTRLSLPSVQLNGVMHLPNEGDYVMSVKSAFGEHGIYGLRDGRFGIKIQRRNTVECLIFHKEIESLLKFLEISLPEFKRL